MRLFKLLLLLFLPAMLHAQPGMTREKYREDFNFFWKSVQEEYSYFDKKQTDWPRVKELYAAALDSVTNRDQFVNLLERVLYEIYDHHAILNTNTMTSHRLVPSGTDTWAEYINGKPIITEIRPGFGTALSGIHTGMEVIAVNDIPIANAVQSMMPRSLKQEDMEARNFALRLVLAGDHTSRRKLTLMYKGKTSDYYPDSNARLLENIHYNSNIETKMFGTTGYIRINDCLYNTDLVPEFDSVIQSMTKTSSLIIDLRNTPSGGNTIVAKAILSWFITREHFYQKHEYPAEEAMSRIRRSWVEIVSPRKGKSYTKPLVILCDHWTASLGEAIVIGFEALKRPSTKVIGTPMARLLGAVYSYEMPNSRIHFGFPAERLYTVDGQPRENYVPSILVNTEATNAYGDDPFIKEALKWLQKFHAAPAK